MSTDFQPVEDAVHKLAAIAAHTHSTDFTVAADALNTIVEAYTGRRSDRTHIEQNLFTATQTFLRRWNKEKSFTDELTDLVQEYDIYRRLVSPHDPIGRDVLSHIPATPLTASGPVSEIDTGPTITPAAFTASVDLYEANSIDMQRLVDMAQVAVHLISVNGGPPDKFDINPLKIAVKAVETETLNPAELNLFNAAQSFLVGWRGWTTFGDDVEKEWVALSDALTNLVSPPAPPVPDPYLETPYLYILMRNDLDSMNAGKAVAQGSHAANQMVFEARKVIDDNVARPVPDEIVALEDLIEEWENSANGFGTCICLTVNEKQMRATVAAAQEAGLHAGLCNDPSYPLRDGSTLHLIPLDTCGYVFGKKGETKPFVGEYSLMP